MKCKDKILLVRQWISLSTENWKMYNFFQYSDRFRSVKRFSNNKIIYIYRYFAEYYRLHRILTLTRDLQWTANNFLHSTEAVSFIFTLLCKYNTMIYLRKYTISLWNSELVLLNRGWNNLKQKYIWDVFNII